MTFRDTTSGAISLGVVAGRLACAAIALLSFGTSARADDDGRITVVKVKKAITVSGEEITDAVIVIKDGKIDAVGKNVTYPTESRVIDARDMIAMPGMINPYARLGPERPTGFVPPQQPGRRRGGGGPPVGGGGGAGGNRSNIKVSDTFFPPQDDTFRDMLEAGYTTVALYPDGSGLPGQYLVLHTHEPAPKTAGLKNEGVLRVTFSNPQRDKRVVKDAFKAAHDAIEAEKTAATQPASAPGARPGGRMGGFRRGGAEPTSGPTTGPATRPTTAPATQPTTGPTTQPASRPATQPARPELTPLIGLLKKQAGKTALIEFSRASDAVHFADAMADYEFARAYLFVQPSADLNYIVDNTLFTEAKALVALTPTLRNMPLTVNPYNAARRFVDAGSMVAFYPPANSVEAYQQMRESLAFMVRNGLSRGDALRAVTLNAAKMLQLDDQLGAIEKGRRADLIFLDGDPLDPLARVQRVMIDGHMVFKAGEGAR